MSPWMARWQRLPKRQQLIACLAGGGLLLGTVDALLLRPLRRQLGHLRQDVRTAEQQLVEAVIANNQAKAVNRAFSDYEPYVRPVGSPEAELASVLSEMEDAVHQSGLVLLSLKPVPPQGAAANTVSVTIEGESTPDQLWQLLDAIQRSTRLLRVTDLTVRVTEGRNLRSSFVISRLLLASPPSSGTAASRPTTPGPVR